MSGLPVKYHFISLVPIYKGRKETIFLPLVLHCEAFQQLVLLLLQVEHHLDHDGVFLICHDHSQNPGYTI